MRVELDARRYVELRGGNPQPLEIIRAADTLRLTSVVVGELRAEFAVGNQGPGKEAVRRRFLQKPGVGVPYAGKQTTSHYPSLYRQQRKQGTPIPINDM